MFSSSLLQAYIDRKMTNFACQLSKGVKVGICKEQLDAQVKKKRGKLPLKDLK